MIGVIVLEKGNDEGFPVTQAVLGHSTVVFLLQENVQNSFCHFHINITFDTETNLPPNFVSLLVRILPPQRLTFKADRSM